MEETPPRYPGEPTTHPPGEKTRLKALRGTPSPLKVAARVAPAFAIGFGRDVSPLPRTPSSPVSSSSSRCEIEVVAAVKLAFRMSGRGRPGL